IEIPLTVPSIHGKHAIFCFLFTDIDSVFFHFCPPVFFAHCSAANIPPAKSLQFVTVPLAERLQQSAAIQPAELFRSVSCASSFGTSSYSASTTSFVRSK